MAFLTIFSSPKPFTNPHIATIQRNAIRSWTLLPDVDVILIGEEEGLAQVAAELGVRHLPDVARNEKGTPLVSSIFNLARCNCDSALLAYVNADVIFLPDMVESARVAASRAKNFLIVGQRWDLGVTELLDFFGDWPACLRERTIREGQLHPPTGSDYFIFPRAAFVDIPHFAIGRAGWDNWMIYKARAERWQAIDATESIMVIHQNHDYSHLPGGQPHYRLPETDENIRLAGGREITYFTLRDTDRRLAGGTIRGRRWNLEKLRRTIETFPLLYMGNYALTQKLSYYFRRIQDKLEGRK